MSVNPERNTDMKRNKTYAVFGLGRFGRAVAIALVENGAEVIAVDLDESVVNDLADEIPICKCADITDPDVIKQLGISNVDTVIIAMAENLEASVMSTMLCKDCGVPNVMVKCSCDTHCRILKKIGADKVFIPEVESGVRMAKNLLTAGLVDIVELSKKCSIAEIDVRPEWLGKSPAELNIRRKYSVNIAAIKQNGCITTSIDPDMPLDMSMKLIVIADTDKLNRLI